MKNLSYMNECRVSIFRDGYLGDEFNGAFNVKIKGEDYFIIASNSDGWEHVSVSHKHKIPSWNVMNAVKDMFFNEEEVVMQIHPKKSEYVNCHPRCLHLWRPIGKEIPTPPTWMVGPKK